MIFKKLFRPGLRFAYWGLSGWKHLTGQPFRGTAVALWHGEALLLVRHSYRPGYSLPGGFLRRGEDPRLGACREIREELGVEIAPRDLVLVTDSPVGRYHDHVFACRLGERPAVRIDDWEIVEALFVEPAELAAGAYRIEGNLKRAPQVLSRLPSR